MAREKYDPQKRPDTGELLTKILAKKDLKPESRRMLENYKRRYDEAMRMPMEWSGNFMEELEKKAGDGAWKAKILLRELNKDPRIVSLFRQGFLGQA